MSRFSRISVAALAFTATALPVLSACAQDQAAPPAIQGQPAPAASSPGSPAASSPESPAASPQAIDACALVSKKEAESLAGTPLEDAVAARESCSYTGPVSGPTAQVEIYVGDGAKKILDIDRDLGHNLKALNGIGDEAYLEDGSVFVGRSGVWVAIRLVRLDDPAIYQKRLEDLARIVAGRI